DGVRLLAHQQQPVALVRLRRLDAGAGDRLVVLDGLAPADDDLEIADLRLDGDLHEAFGRYSAPSDFTTPWGHNVWICRRRYYSAGPPVGGMAEEASANSRSKVGRIQTRL